MTAQRAVARPACGGDYYLARAEYYESAAEREPNLTIRAALETIARAYRLKTDPAVG
jgi:hypothetical protein